MATRRKGARKKKCPPNKTFQKLEDEEQTLLGTEERGGLQISEACEIIDTFSRRYVRTTNGGYNIEEVNEILGENDFTTLSSPNKKKENMEEREEDDMEQSCHKLFKNKENLVPTPNTRKSQRILKQQVGKKETPLHVKRLHDRGKSHSRQSSIEPQEPSKSLSRNSSLEPKSLSEHDTSSLSLDKSLTTPENHSTLPFVLEGQPKKRFSNFGFSKLNASPEVFVHSTLPPTPPATVDSYAFLSPSQSSIDRGLGVNKKAVKVLKFESVPPSSPSLADGDGFKKGQKKVSTKRKLKKESQDFEEWAECINKEFEEIDDFQLIID